jgi:hypothetical protein
MLFVKILKFSKIFFPKTKISSRKIKNIFGIFKNVQNQLNYTTHMWSKLQPCLLTMVATKRPHSRRGRFKGLGTRVVHWA